MTLLGIGEKELPCVSALATVKAVVLLPDCSYETL